MDCKSIAWESDDQWVRYRTSVLLHGQHRDTQQAAGGMRGARNAAHCGFGALQAQAPQQHGEGGGGKARARGLQAQFLSPSIQPVLLASPRTQSLLKPEDIPSPYRERFSHSETQEWLPEQEG